MTKCVYVLLLRIIAYTIRNQPKQHTFHPFSYPPKIHYVSLKAVIIVSTLAWFKN